MKIAKSARMKRLYHARRMTRWLIKLGDKRLMMTLDYIKPVDPKG